MLGREAGEKEKESARGRWEEQRKGAGLFLSSHRPSRAFCFSGSLLFLLGYPTGASAEERPLETIKKNCLHDGSMVTTLVAICNTRFCHFHPFFFTKHAKGSAVAEHSFSRIAFNIPLSRGDMRPISF